jgi:hypothetical protein
LAIVQQPLALEQAGDGDSALLVDRLLFAGIVTQREHGSPLAAP